METLIEIETSLECTFSRLDICYGNPYSSWSSKTLSISRQLKDLEIKLEGGRPWGFRVAHGTSMDFLGWVPIVSHVEDGSEAFKGLRVGDVLLSVNGVACSSPEEAQNLVDSTVTTLLLHIWRGEGDVERNKSSSKDQSNSANDPTPSDSTTASASDLSTGNTSSSASLNANSSSKVKVERRESARLASGASKFLRSLRSHKEPKDQINVIALKEIDGDHCLSPEGKGQTGYNRTAGIRLPERSQSFQEKRLLVVTSKSTTESAGGPNGHVKVKHSRAQSFVCNSQPSHGFLNHHPHQQNYNKLQNQANKVQQLKQKNLQQQQQNIYSTPQNINGLPPPPPGSTSRTAPLKSCETIYENLEVILEQNNLNKNTRTNPEEKKSQEPSKTGEESSLNPQPNPKMTIFEKDRDRRPSRKLTKDSGYETNYSDYTNIDALTSSTDSVDSPLSKEFPRSPPVPAAYGIVGSHGDQIRSGSSSSGVTVPQSGDNERSLTTPGLPNPNTTVSNESPSMTDYSSPPQNSHKPEDQVDGNDLYSNENISTTTGKMTLLGMMEGRKLRRSISEVPSERMLFPKPCSKKMDPSRSVYSSVGNGLSIWNLENARLSKSGSAQALYKSSSGSSNYLPNSSRTLVGPPLAKVPTYPPVYSTLPRNHTSGTTSDGTYQSYYQIGAKSTPSLKHAVAHEPPHVDGTSGGLVQNKSSSNPIYQSIPSLSPARSTPNLGSSLGKLQVHPQIPAYRQPPVYQPGNSLGRIYQSPASIQQHNSGPYQTPASTSPTKSCSIESPSVEKSEKQSNESLYESRKLSVSSTSSSSTTETSQSSGTTTSTLPNNCASQNTCQSQNPQCNNNSINSSNPVGQGSTVMSNGVGNLANGGGSWIQPESPSNSTPVRDSSSVKQIRYGPGHEKYPSWPIPATSSAEVDPAGEANSNKLISSSGSARSKSWTEQTDYPKEKVSSYARPYMKRMNQAYTQQLKTVMEKCESLNGDKSLKNVKGGQRGPQNGYGGILPPPLGYRDQYNQNGHYNQQFGQQSGVNNCTSPVSVSDSKEYNIPSPPERDVLKPLTQEDLELYSKKYEEMMSQYAHSEGYHSYISSECSSYVSSGTPFLDLLRRESGELNQQFWSQDSMDPNDPLFGMSHLTASGRESVTTVVTNSSSNSSGTETLKWGGSGSDISLASGSNGSNMSSTSHNNIRMWEQQNSQQQQQQNIAHSAKIPMPQKLHPESVPVHHFETHQQIQNGIRQMKNKLLESQSTSPTKSWSAPSSDSSREINLKKFPLNTYTRPSTLPIEKPQTTPEKAANILPPKESSTNSAQPPTPASKSIMSQPSTSPIIDTSKPPSVAERIWELEQKQSSSSSSSQTSSPKTNQTQAQTSNLVQNEKFVKSSSLNNLREKSQPLTSLSVTCPLQQQSQGQSNKTVEPEQTAKAASGTESYKNLWSGYSSDTSSSSSSGANKNPSQPTNNSTSVNRVTDSPINPPGSFSQISYSYLDPEKKHKVADMTLKAIQKKALLSYYERHTGKSTSSSSSVSSSDSCASGPTTSSNKNQSQAQQSSPSSPPSNGTGPESITFHQPTNVLLDKDSPFPGKSNRLTLSLPRDIDRLKEPAVLSPFGSPASATRNSPETETSNNGQTGNPNSPSNSPSSVMSTRGSSHTTNSSSSFKHKSHHPVPTSLPAKSHDINQVDKGEIGSPGEEPSGESARLAYMSKYLPHLVNRDGSSSWNGVKSSSSGGAINSSGAMSSAAVTIEPAPIPPERPPKKPHLRNLSQQSSDDGKESSPPPPLPRAPIRPTSTTNKGPAAGAVVANIITGAPPVPSKPVVAVPVSAGVAVARCTSPELPPPPPPIAEEEVDVINNDEPLPPPPTLTEVSNCLGARSRSVSGLSSYLHKDSYLAQRKERTLGYEGRYRRTLSPSGLGSNNKSVEPVSMGSTNKTMSNATSTGKLDTSLTPSAWEKYHNIRPPSTTVIFTSHEIAKSPVSPPFHRSISCDSNLFNNKTGFTQSTIPPPVAQVAPLRGSDTYPYNEIGSETSLEKVDPFLTQSSSGSSASSSSQSLAYCHSPISGVRHDERIRSREYDTSPSLNLGESDGYGSLKGKSLGLADAGCQISPDFLSPMATTPPNKGSMSSLPSVKVSPLQYDRSESNKDNSPSPDRSSPFRHTDVKKSEVSLRVNCTSDVGSQTDMANQEKKRIEPDAHGKMRSNQRDMRTLPTERASLDNLTMSSSSSSSSGSSGSTTVSSCSSSFDDNSLAKGAHLSIISSYTGRQKTQEELECEELSRHLIKHLPQGDKLQTILVPLPEHKTTADYMEGLFHLELKLKQEKSEKETNTSARSSPDLLQSLPRPEGNQLVIGRYPEAPLSPVPNGDTNIDSIAETKRCNGHAPLPADSAYFTTSECKAKFLTQYVKDMNRSDSAFSRTDDSQELNKQKELLVSRISRKLEILRTEQLEIREEIQSNEQLGHQVIDRVKEAAKRNEFDKFKLHVEEIEKITSLLLGLSGRLARAENALMGFAQNSNPQEKKILESKRDKLREQLDEAKILKENIDRRSAQVSSFLQKYLTAEEYADYQHFVKMKAKLIIDAREIDDKIKLGVEQMEALKDTINS